MREQYGEWINIKTVQKIMYFNSSDAVLLAVQKGALPLPIRSAGRISTDLLAKYIANQYVAAVSDKTVRAQSGRNNKIMEVENEIDKIN